MRAALVVAVLGLAACGDDGTGFGLGDVDLEDAPEVARRAICHHAAMCGLFPDEATCLRSNNGVVFTIDPSLVKAVRDGRVKYDGRKLGDCYEQLGDATCDRTDADGRSFVLGCVGAIEGTVGDGGACAVEAECISGVCNIPDCPDACCPGTCVGGTAPDREAPIGAACGAQASCTLGAYCSMGTCTALKAADETCTSASECDYGLGCAGTPRTCRPLALLGEACTSDGGCRDEGQYCHQMTMVCTQVGLPGDACAPTGARCSSYYECNATTMICEEGAAIGETCANTSDCFDFGTYCKGTTCAEREPVGGACDSDSDCENNTCGASGTCEQRPTCSP